MNIAQLKYFQAITKNSTFLDAAEDMNISQSSLSKQLNKLEEELGVALIDRSKRSASLTEAGKVFALDVGEILRQYDLMLAHMQIFQKKQHALKIGSLAFLGQYGLNFKLANFDTSHPEFNLVVEDVEEDILIEGFRNGLYDVIIGRTLPEDIPCEFAEKLADDELVAVMRKSHPSAAKKFIELSQIVSMPLFLTKTYTSIYKICMQLFHENKIIPSKVFTSRSETIISMISTQNAVGLLPRKGLDIFQHSELTVVPVVPSAKIPVMIYAKNKNSKIVQKLFMALRSQERSENV
ncbi:MAG: LysR family transcriptional regulator, partial [Synergistaceae bacterium]|nr:LysR family transcriptional regulator [Synergistaceae bacterium]